MTTRFRSLLAAGVFAAALAGIGIVHAGDLRSGPAAGSQAAGNQVAGQQLQLQAVPITACGLKFKKVKEDPKSYLCRTTFKPACAKGYNFGPGGVKLVGNKIEYLCFKPQG